jgi:hypothetical protein
VWPSKNCSNKRSLSTGEALNHTADKLGVPFAALSAVLVSAAYGGTSTILVSVPDGGTQWHFGISANGGIQYHFSISQ